MMRNSYVDMWDPEVSFKRERKPRKESQKSKHFIDWSTESQIWVGSAAKFCPPPLCVCVYIYIYIWSDPESFSQPNLSLVCRMGLFTAICRASSLTHRGRATSLFLHRYMSNVPENTVYGRPASQNPNERVTLAHLRQKHKKGEPITVDENGIFCCGLDLSYFFECKSLFRSFESNPRVLKKQRLVSEKSAGSSSNFSRRSLDTGFGSEARIPRWVEFWSDAAVDRRQRNSSSSSNSSPERFFDMPRFEIPKWVDEYVEQIGSILRNGGCSELDISEIVEVSASEHRRLLYIVGVAG